MTLEQFQERLSVIRGQLGDLMGELPHYAEDALYHLQTVDALLASADEQWPEEDDES